MITRILGILVIALIPLLPAAPQAGQMPSEPAGGDLVIVSLIPDVDFYLDGAAMGKLGNGLFRGIPAGEHLIELKGDGVYCGGRVTIAEGGIIQLQASPYEVGSIRYILPTDIRAELVGGNLRKTLSGSGYLENVKTGIYSLEYGFTPYETETIRITVVKGATAEINLRSTAVEIRTNPPFAAVYLDGNYVGASPLTLDLVKPGRHSIGARIEGYYSADLDVNVVAGVGASYDLLLEAIPVRVETVLAKGGTFTMCSPDGTDYHGDNELQHDVTVSDFYIGTYEVTQRQYRMVMGTNPSAMPYDDNPVENVSWYDAVEFCNRLSLRSGLDPAYTIDGEEITWNRDAGGYRLPTEAEWEYAAKGGAVTLGKGTRLVYSGGNEIDPVAWFSENSGDLIGYIHPVGRKQANELGLYDMSGNAAEWCWDMYESWQGYTYLDPQTNPAGPSGTAGPAWYDEDRIIRGGSWTSMARSCSATCREYGRVYLAMAGFRIVLPAAN